MIRKALIIYCDDTESGPLVGPQADNTHVREHLTSKMGGEWYEREMVSLNNPTIKQVKHAVSTHLADADYTFTVFSGHGGVNSINKRQYLELADGDIPISDLTSNSKRQTLIIDSCRGFYTPAPRLFSKSLDAALESLSKPSTRKIFDLELAACEEGQTILFAASVNQTARDSNRGGAYLFSILRVSELWYDSTSNVQKFSLKDAHDRGVRYMNVHFSTTQTPVIEPEKRRNFFPLAVKATVLKG
jgi:hypothetical protein